MDFARLPTPFAIVGTGLSGQAAFELLRAQGVPETQVIFFDDAEGRGQYSDPEKLMREYHPRTLVVSPGYPLSKSWIQSFEASGGIVTSELELACVALEKESVVAVTGSVGKSTTVSLLGAGAQKFCDDVFVGGNLGTPLATYAAQVLRGDRKRTAWIILELSSFQLERARNLKCAGAVITSLTRNHLERYPSLDAYYLTKWNLVKSTQGPVVLNSRGGDLKAFVGQHGGATQVHWTSRSETSLTSAQFQAAKLLGTHNRDNLAVANELAKSLGWPEIYLEGMLEFEGLPHRLEPVGTFGGIRFVNDSKATAIESVLTAVDSLQPQGPIVLLLGGRDKKLPWENLAELERHPQVRVVFFGECGALASQKSRLHGPAFRTLKEALQGLRSLVAAGETVLLSPGGSSLDEFKNFEARGTFFAKTVKDLFS